MAERRNTAEGLGEPFGDDIAHPRAEFGRLRQAEQEGVPLRRGVRRGDGVHGVVVGVVGETPAGGIPVQHQTDFTGIGAVVDLFDDPGPDPPLRPALGAQLHGRGLGQSGLPVGGAGLIDLEPVLIGPQVAVQIFRQQRFGRGFDAHCSPVM